MHVDINPEFTVVPLGDSSLIYGSQKVQTNLLKTVFMLFSTRYLDDHLVCLPHFNGRTF